MLGTLSVDSVGHRIWERLLLISAILLSIPSFVASPPSSYVLGYILYIIITSERLLRSYIRVSYPLLLALTSKRNFLLHVHLSLHYLS